MSYQIINPGAAVFLSKDGSPVEITGISSEGRAAVVLATSEGHEFKFIQDECLRKTILAAPRGDGLKASFVYCEDTDLSYEGDESGRTRRTLTAFFDEETVPLAEWELDSTALQVAMVGR